MQISIKEKQTCLLLLFLFFAGQQFVEYPLQLKENLKPSSSSMIINHFESRAACKTEIKQFYMNTNNCIANK